MAESPLSIAIVGGGIIGLMTALGLTRRGLRVTVYERAAQWPDYGAGFAFTAVARESMRRLDPDVLAALLRVGARDPSPTFQYWDGAGPGDKAAAADPAAALIFEVPEHHLGFVACLRSRFLLEMAGLLAARAGTEEDLVRFNKQLVGLRDRPGEKVVLRFGDGTTAEADVVLGCDGVHSTMRRELLGHDHPAAQAHYAHKTVYRALVPLPGAMAALGAAKASRSGNHLGPGAHIVSYPVQSHNLYNLYLFVHDDGDWPHDAPGSAVPSSRDEALRALAGWGPHVRELAALLPPRVSKHAIFDMLAHPAPTYARGRACIAGDAAHASCPFHGSGTTMGVEDGLVLAELLADVAGPGDAQARAVRVEAALRAYSEVRMARSQWVVRSSREMGDMFEFRHAAVGRDGDRLRREFEERARVVWDFDVDGMVARAKEVFGRNLQRQ
ncbi:hypothetical protein P8C59_001513 [Phyllachora maydis]|uniref:Uncharacterized protein n=1 Tax=Phyllachora maydis TaxID=1825666 RepID=A0AAD9HYJ3_9PEZI|nr:hypothetical protein P8C59_001513 [Phyllachora maydis]